MFILHPLSRLIVILQAMCYIESHFSSRRRLERSSLLTSLSLSLISSEKSHNGEWSVWRGTWTGWVPVIADGGLFCQAFRLGIFVSGLRYLGSVSRRETKRSHEVQTGAAAPVASASCSTLNIWFGRTVSQNTLNTVRHLFVLILKMLWKWGRIPWIQSEFRQIKYKPESLKKPTTGGNRP